MFDGDALPAGMPKTDDATFDVWIQKMAKSSPADPKDTAEFEYITFSECVLLCFIEPIVGGMGPGASSLRDC